MTTARLDLSSPKLRPWHLDRAGPRLLDARQVAGARPVESFLIKSASGEGALEFLDRLPADAGLPIEEFRIRVADANLSASSGIYAGSGGSHPATLFREMAERWRGWTGELAWGSLEGEMGLRCTQGRGGHVSILIQLRSGPMEWDWSVEATVMVEAGQLEEVARRAESFFGRAD